MASDAVPWVPMGAAAAVGAAPQHEPARRRFRPGAAFDAAERFLAAAGFDRAPWLAVAFAAGIGAWFALPDAPRWLALLALCGGAAAGAYALPQGAERWPYLRQAVAALTLAVALGCGAVWAKSALVGTPAIARPLVTELTATVLTREEQPAEARVRLVLAMREPGTGRAIRVRVNLPAPKDRPGLAEGAVVRLRARLMPPAPPMLPGGYDFARTAWFSGLAATGGVLGEVAVVKPAATRAGLRETQRRLSAHVRGELGGSPGTIAAAFASGDRGAIAPADDEAMRDAGLTHLLSVSGLHVSAVIAAAYLLALKLLGLWPWLALRVRLPLVAAAVGAGAGVGYTLLTGAEVPTVRSCIGALLVLLALALGREPLSLRMLAVGAVLVLLLWPEAVVGPSFQMSFAAVLAIVALHGSGPARAFLAPREEPWWHRGLRRLAMLLATGVAIELALMPIGLFHFHRAGVYGALANVVAIPLTTFVSMPLIALALLFDTVGAGAPLWWLAGQSLEALLGIAHWTAGQPGAVTALPAAGVGPVLLFVAGGLWLALWSGRVRLLGLLAAVLGAGLLASARAPDILVSSDGRHVGITGAAGGELLVLRESRSDFAKDNLLELAGMDGTVRGLDDWPGARCNAGFCAMTLRRGGRNWRLLLLRGRNYVPVRALVATCDRADIVIADRWLPAACKPRLLKADRGLLERSGGLAIDLTARRVTTVAAGQGAHGWWRPPEPRPRPQPRIPATPAQ
ncbi:MAG: ComEC/Rec2 family competence protein [Novosphingobium sp.]